MCINFGLCVVVLPTLCQKGTLIFKFIPVSESNKPVFPRIAQCIFTTVIALFAFCFSSYAAPDGKALFQSNCAACHNPLKDATGPALKGVDARVPSKEWLHDWVHNSQGVVQRGDKYANELYGKWK